MARFQPVGCGCLIELRYAHLEDRSLSHPLNFFLMTRCKLPVHFLQPGAVGRRV